MLILSRVARAGKDETVYTIPAGTVIPPAGLEIRNKVLSVTGGQVRMGHTVPDEVRVLRGELDLDNRGNK